MGSAAVITFGAWVVPTAVLTCGAGGAAKGLLIITTEWNTSGRTSEHQAAMGDPQSCPTTAATDR